MTATTTNVVEAYAPATDTWSRPLQPMPTARSGGGYGTDGRRIYVAGGEVTTTQLTGAFRAVEAYDPASNTWSTLPSMTIPRHGVAGAVIGNEFHLVSGMIQSAGSMVFLDPQIATNTAAHDFLELKSGPNAATSLTDATSKAGAPPSGLGQ
jgi:N-acetylneuraminic acid mutarotase